MNLDDAREGIDQIDRQMLDLFEKRMGIVQEVAAIKKEQSLPIFQPQRETDLIKWVKNSASEENKFYASTLYNYILELSKIKQRELLYNGNNHNNQFLQTLESKQTPILRPRVFVQGIKGSYANAAASKLYPDGTLTYVNKWEDILYAIRDGSCDYGVLPVENSMAGSVHEVYDLLIKYKYFIVKALPLKVEHCLLGIRGASLKNIKRVYSHPHAFPQCKEFFLKNYKLKQIPFLNTAMAAEYVAREGNIENAAIASRECAHNYGLDILMESIQQNDSNCTRFISVSKRPEISENASKISLVLTLPHVTGSLYRTLARFATNGLNLTNIESRPNTQKNFEYFFYIEFTGSVKSPGTLQLLSALSEELPSFYFLGNYYEPQ